ncbi:MFS transporter [Mesobacillus zeae]|uniref:MFS transporter n=1 Tax=Mesobacillus zeae TaxID=1917180 RepID=A0A398BDC4_9BACI|nr:MFS transporter [Mesobacillus zeae]RID87807.1 MFS transporter [Mesobacillus zeae]
MVQRAEAVRPQQMSKGKTAYKILFIIGMCHLLNDSIQAVIPAMFPILEKSMGLSFTQLGIIAFALNIVSSILQPVIGMVTDKRPMPYALPLALAFTFVGVLMLAAAPNFEMIILSVILIGLGSAGFHPQGSRVAYMGAGQRRGLAQSIYQVGGNSGQALAPLITALILVPFGQKGAFFFSIVAAAAVGLLVYIARWYSLKLGEEQRQAKGKRTVQKRSRKVVKSVRISLILILFLIFARSWYIAGMTNFYSFFAIDKYGLTISEAQMFLFAFLVAGAVGTFFGGPLADRFGKKNIILLSMLGTLPVTVVLPFVSAAAAFFLLILSGFILMLSFSVTVVYAQELVPGKIGTMAGLTVGLAFGMGAVGSVGLGYLADIIGLPNTIILTGFLPFLGILTMFLPSDDTLESWNRQ